MKTYDEVFNGLYLETLHDSLKQELDIMDKHRDDKEIMDICTENCRLLKEEIRFCYYWIKNYTERW